MAKYSSRQPRYSSRRRASTGRVSIPSGRAAMPAISRRSPLPILIIAVVIAGAIACWIVGKGCGTQKGQTNASLKSYTNAVDDPVNASAAVAKQFDTLKSTVNKVAKTDVEKQLAKMVSDNKSVARTSAKVSAPTSATSLQPLAQLGFDMRTQGVTEYQAGIMGILNNTDTTAATQSVSKGLQDLVVSDSVLARYKNLLDAKLKASKQDIQVADPGKFVPNPDDASSMAVSLYVRAVNPKSTTGTTTAAAASPSQAIQAYLKQKGIDYSGMSLSVASTSSSDSSWKLDVATGLPDGTTYFLVHQVNGNWTVVETSGSFTASQLKTAGAPSDLTPPSSSSSSGNTSTDTSNQ